MFKDSGSWNPFKKEDPKELVRRWQATIRKETRAIDRQILDVKREQKKAERMIKEAAKRQDIPSAKILAKEYATMRRTVGKLAVNKAHFINLNTQLAQQLAMVKVAGTLSKSTEVMSMVNRLIKVPELSRTMAEMSREMMKAGMIDEMVGDAMGSALEEEALEEESQAQVDAILMEVAGETLEQMAAAPARARPAAARAQAAKVEREEGLAEGLEGLALKG